MSKVFATQESGRHNLSHAMEFGDLEVLTERDFPSFRGGDDMARQIREKLSYFIPEQDYLLLVGDPIIMGIAFAALAARNNVKSIRVLKWDRQATRYIPIHVPLTA